MNNLKVDILKLDNAIDKLVIELLDKYNLGFDSDIVTLEVRALLLEYKYDAAVTLILSKGGHLEYDHN